MEALLAIEGLDVEYRSDHQTLRAAHNVTFQIRQGEVVGLVGESGSGKSTVGKALLRLLPPNGRISGGSMLFKGRDLVSLPYEEMRRLRWAEIAMVFQSSMNVLNPVYRVGDQMIEAILVHEPRTGRREALGRVRQLLASVGIDPQRWTAYPHQLSGGMRQRVNIAAAMCLSPDLIIADEPTTALDVVTQDRVLRELRQQQQGRGTSMLLISHDISVIAENCHRVAVMYAGSVVEFASAAAIFSRPCHPYTLGLQNAFPDFRSRRPLISIPGFPPTATEREHGCTFVRRCPFAREVCHRQAPPFLEVGPGHSLACHFAEAADEFRRLAPDPATWTAAARTAEVVQIAGYGGIST